MPAASEPVNPTSTKASGDKADSKPAVAVAAGKPKLVAVTLSQSYGKYNTGETAGFKPDEADQLVAGKKGVYAKAKK